MIARIATCHDLAKNEVDLGKITGSFWSLRACATPTALILPWFPSLARVGQLMAHYKIFRVLSKHIEARRRVEPTSDAIDVLIAEGETTRNIVQASFRSKLCDREYEPNFSVCPYGIFRGYRQYQHLL